MHNTDQRYKILVNFSQTLTSSVQLKEDEILQLIYENASKLMDTDNMYIALYDESTDTVRFGLVYKEGREINTKKGEEEEGYKPRQGGQGKTEYIIKTKEPIFHPALIESEAWYEKPGHFAYDRSILPSWVGVPMITGKKVLGVVATYNPIQEHVYNNDDLEILQAMANLAAIASDNARLYSETKQQAKELEEKTKMLELAIHKIAETQDIVTRSFIAADIVHRLNNLVGTIPIWANSLKEKVEDMTDEIQHDINDMFHASSESINKIITKSQYVDFISRLRNLAGTIPIWTDQLRKETDSKTNEIQNDVDNLISEVERLKKPSQQEKVDINLILETILNQLRIQYRKEIQSDRLKIKEEIYPELHNVIGLYSSVSNAIINVISNGIESILEDSGILNVILVEAANYTDNRNSEWLNIEITDTGKGIPEKDIDRIFAAFFSTKGSDRGYGLWRAKAIIENLGGNISVNSQHGDGATFSIRLPKAKENLK